MIDKFILLFTIIFIFIYIINIYIYLFLYNYINNEYTEACDRFFA